MLRFGRNEDPKKSRNHSLFDLQPEDDIEERIKALDMICEAAKLGGLGKHLCSSAEVHKQYLTMTSRLAKTKSHTWFHKDGTIKSGTVILADLLTKADLYIGCECVVWLIANCALKSLNEAVVEGMGCILDRHGSDARNLGQVKISREAVVHYNGPTLLQSRHFLTEVNNDLHGCTTWATDSTYHHVDPKQRSVYALLGGQVMKKYSTNKSKFPFTETFKMPRREVQNM